MLCCVGQKWNCASRNVVVSVRCFYVQSRQCKYCSISSILFDPIPPQKNHFFMSFYSLHIPWIYIYKKKRALEHSQPVMVNFHELFPTFHHVLHSTFSIGFTSLCLLVQTLHRCFLNEPSVLLSFLQGLNYTIEREKQISFTHSQQCCLSLSPSLSQCFSHFFGLTAFTRLRLTVAELHNRRRCRAA